MAAYFIARINVTDWNKFKHYLEASPSVLKMFDGTYIARGGEIVTLEGPEETRRVVLVEFPTLEQAKEFYNSSEYQEVIKLRKDAAIAEIIVVDGINFSQLH
jgi:uncharacterized protein (DUF1330 family)